jgi:hypothetical protein
MTRQTVSGDLITDGAITAAKVSDGAITGTKLDAGAALSNIASSSITAAKLATGAALSNIGTGGVTATYIADGAITSAKLASGVGGTPTDGSVTTAKIADSAVTTIKIADGAITSAKLASGVGGSPADGSITTAKLADGAVTTIKITDANVTSAKLATGAAAANIGSGAIAATQLAQPVSLSNKVAYSITYLSGLAVTATGISFSAANVVVNDQIQISGTLGTGVITGYTSPTTYFVTAITGTAPNTTGATLSLTRGGTAVATTAGTFGAATAGWLSAYIDISGIPSWATTVRATFKSLSTSGTDSLRVQLRTASGVESTGYVGGCSSLKSATAIAGGSASSGFNIYGVLATDSIHGVITLSLHESATNTWMANGLAWNSVATEIYVTAGYKSLSGALTGIRFANSQGSGNWFYWDGGEINVSYW